MTTHIHVPTSLSPQRWDPLLTADQVSELIGFKPDTLTKWRTRNPGRAPRAVKLKQIVRYRTSDVYRWMDEHTGAPTSAQIPIESPDRLLSGEEAAAYLAISKSSIATWRSREPDYAPPGTRVGSRVKYRLTALNEWVEWNLESQTQPTDR